MTITDTKIIFHAHEKWSIHTTHEYSTDIIVNIAENITEIIAKSTIISNGKDKVVTASLSLNNREQKVAIKIFGKQSFLKDWHDKKKRSKAQRSFEAAIYLINHKINTPKPVAVIEQWKGHRLVESYYICLFEPAISFRDALLDIYHHQKDSAALMELLLLVAPAIKKMHDAGFQHGDMGNQNILLPKNIDGSWGGACFIDLNRYKLYTNGLTDKARAFDLSRPILPGNYLKFFLQIYLNNEPASKNFGIFQEKYRTEFTRHRHTRKFRRPIRHFINRHKKPDHKNYPHTKDYWLWDEKTAQPMIALSKKEKHQERSLKDFFISAYKALFSFPKILKQYKYLQKKSFENPVYLKNKIGIALHANKNYIDIESNFLSTLGNPPVLIRFYCHESLPDWNNTIQLIESLSSKGISIMVAMLQDRDAILIPEKWKNFLEFVIPKIVDKTEHIEITHAYNRIKWGIWNLTELRQLLSISFDYKKRFPQLNITGPACIDFEYIPVISALKELHNINSNYQFDALSHLLYVDRRGAPENKQGKFSTLEKACMLKAIAQTSAACKDKVILSEVNWPIENTDIWSPIVCPYVTTYWQTKPSGEPEDIYAHFMLRYLAITICSGHIDQVFWWRLSAKGYGLIDDQDNFRERPAFIALKFLLRLLGESRFEKKWSSDSDSYLLEFSYKEKRYLMAWTTKQPQKIINIKFNTAWNYLGNEIETCELTGAPIYLLLSD